MSRRISIFPRAETGTLEVFAKELVHQSLKLLQDFGGRSAGAVILHRLVPHFDSAGPESFVSNVQFVEIRNHEFLYPEHFDVPALPRGHARLQLVDPNAELCRPASDRRCIHCPEHRRPCAPASGKDSPRRRRLRDQILDLPSAISQTGCIAGVIRKSAGAADAASICTLQNKACASWASTKGAAKRFAIAPRATKWNVLEV